MLHFHWVKHLALSNTSGKELLTTPGYKRVLAIDCSYVGGIRRLGSHAAIELKLVAAVWTALVKKGKTTIA